MAFLPSNYWLCRDLSENTASQIQWTSMLDFFVLVHIKSPFIEVNPHFQTQSYPVFIGYIIIFEAWIPVLVRVSLHVWWSVVSLHVFFLYRKSLLQLRIRCQESAYQGGRSRWLVLSRQSSVPKNAHTQRYIMIIAILLWRSIFYLLWLLLSLYIVVISSAKSLFMLSLHIILPYILPISFHYIYMGALFLQCLQWSDIAEVADLLFHGLSDTVEGVGTHQHDIQHLGNPKKTERTAHDTSVDLLDAFVAHVPSF